MWWTPDGERVLQGAEAALFREALGTLVDMVRDDDEGMWQFSAPPFDALPPNQKLAVLAQVGTALLRQDEPMPRLTAVLEAAVGAVYESIRVMVEIEIDEPAEDHESPSWRELVLAACRDRRIDDLLDPESWDLDEWQVLVECLEDAILWDVDWRDAENHLDADPQANRVVKQLLGIDEDYYVAVPPDPTEEQMKGIRATLRRLTRDTAEPR